MVMMRSLARELVRYKRIGEPKDAGKAVFLASDDSDYIMGMYVDGGMTRHPELASGG